MYISVNTVKKHINHIFGKLDVKNRTQAIAKTRQLNILP
ncbi:MAG: LuxR C-terminal-related transcriptional regulator [Acidiferrobacterales bacterium]|nr:LuxR C-terminal-related transcriptional regulator [Acidiferrobacterales bacterium]